MCKVVILHIVGFAHFLVISHHSPRRLSASLLHYLWLSDCLVMVFSCHISHSLTPVRTRLANIVTRTRSDAVQGELEGERNCFLNRKDMEHLCLHGTSFLLDS